MVRPSDILGEAGDNSLYIYIETHPRYVHQLISHLQCLIVVHVSISFSFDPPQEITRDPTDQDPEASLGAAQICR